MLADKQYDVLLNGQGYLLIEESYEKRAQQPYSPRFATGDPSEGDNSFWQFLSQRGWSGEGQEKFDVTTKYRQSAGWDIRQNGRPYLARGTESVTLDAALVAMQNTATVRLLDDFSGIAPGIWTDGAGTGLVFASHGGQVSLEANGNTIANYGARQAAVGSANGPGRAYLNSVDLGTTGEWRADIYTTTSGVSKVHGSFMFIAKALTSQDDTTVNCYCLEISGADMVTWKLIKTPLYHTDNQSDTVLATLVATAKSATWTTIKITRSAAGLFEVFQDGVSLGTVTDNAYNTGGSVGVSSATLSGTGSPTTYWDNIYVPGVSANNVGVGSKFLNYDNGLYTCWYTGGAAFAFTGHKAMSQANNFPKIRHQNCKDFAVWSRDETPTSDKNIYLVSVLGTTIKAYNGETEIFTASIDIYATCVLPYNSTTVLAIGTTAENSGIPAIQVIKMDAGAWTIASKLFLQADGGTSGTVPGAACLDSNGAVYFVTNDQTANYGCFPSRVFYITSTDILATKPTITSWYTLSDFVARGVFSLAGTVYLYGSRIRGTDAYATVLKYPSTVMWESTLAKSLYPTVDATKFNHGVMSVWKNLDNVLFLGMNDLAIWSPVLQLDLDGNVREVASFAAGQFDYGDPNCVAIAEWNGSFYCLNAQAGTIRRTTTSRGSLGSTFSTAKLQLSDMGTNTALINKSLFSVIVELSVALPAADTLTVYVNGTSVGTMTSASGTRKEITLTAELTSSIFTTVLSMGQASTWTGYVKAVMLKYIPTQFKMRAWGFAIRATKSLRLADGSHESKTPAQLFAAIEAAWASNIPVTFVDVDATSYTVIVTDFKQKRPLLARDRADSNESFYFVELLQAA
jgi:hypothetical protein